MSMRLADYTDYTLRVLMYCAAHTDRLVTIAEMADRYDVSKNHLMKVVNDLGRQGLLETTRGRGGGLRLLKAASTIRIGDVVRAAETDFRLVECFDARTDTCTLTPTCRLRHVLAAALRAYFGVLDDVTLADIASPMPPRGRPSALTVGMRAPRSRTSGRTMHVTPEPVAKGSSASGRRRAS
jgi:Rrf2 family nitric oxide-sensitive transcriptional repressor